MRWPLALTVCLLPLSAWAALRVGVLPVTGEARYPLVTSGLRRVLLSDLSQTGHFELVEVPPGPALGVEQLAELGAGLNVDVFLLSELIEGSPHFTFLLRAYAGESGYNIGSRELTGSYADIKFLQDRLFAAALDLLRVQLPPTRRSSIQEEHTQAVGAVVALGEADAALREKRYVDALAGFSKARSLDPKFGAPRRQLEQSGPEVVRKLGHPAEVGRAYRYLGDPARSLSAFEQALKQHPNDPGALVGKGEVLLSVGRAAEAAELFSRARRIDPQHALAAAGLARAYRQMGRTAEAAAAFEQARELGAADPDVFEALGSLYAARRQNRAAAEAFHGAANLAERGANLSRAKAYYDQANRLFPSSSGLERAADLYLAWGETDLAVTHLNKALFVDPNKDTLFAKLGYALYLNHQTAEAVKKLERACELNASNYEANLHLGLIFAGERQTRARAIKHLETAARLRPGEREVRYRLAGVYLAMNKTSEAVSLLEKLAHTNARDPRAHKELGDAYFEAEDYARAEIGYRRAIELRPNFREAWEGLVRVYVETDRREQVMATIDRVYAIDASDNLLVREGSALLEKLTPPDLLRLVGTFPKVVQTESGEAPINQVALFHLVSEEDWPSRLKRFFSPVVLDPSRVRRDLELALYSRYRVVAGESFGGLEADRFPDAEFRQDRSARTVADRHRLDGLFAFALPSTSRRGELSLVKLDVSLYSAPDAHRYGFPDKSALPSLSYPSREILRPNPRAYFAYLVTALLLFLPVGYFTIYRPHVRGKGNLRVLINYDPRLESFLTLKLSKKQEKERDPKLIIIKDKAKYEKRRFKELLRQKGAWVRRMVGKATLFERVPARSYYCYLYGTIEDGTLSRKTVGNYYMIQKVRVEKGATKEILFQLEKEEAFVTVFVRKGDEEIAGAEIRVDSDPQPVYSRGAAGSFIYCKPGPHKLAVTHENRTVEHRFQVADLNDKIVHIDLMTAEEAEQAAVGGRDLQQVAKEWEAQGRAEDAARLYEKAGEHHRAGELRAEMKLVDGDFEAAAREFIKAREYLRAAQVYERNNDPEKARYLYGLHCYRENDFRKAAEYLEGSKHHALLARIYEQLGEPRKSQIAAARAHLEQGQKLEAAQAFLRAEEFLQAAEIYEGLGDLPKAAMLHAKGENYSVAGELFAQGGDKQRAAMAFERGGLYEQAAALYRELGEMDKVADLLVRDQKYVEAAALYREQGLIDEAIAMCQKVPSSHPEFSQARLLLGRTFAEKGLDDLAIRTLSEARERGNAAFDEAALYTLGLLHEKRSEFSRALAVFEELLKKDFHYRDAGLKVKELKAKAAREEASAALRGAETLSGGAPTWESRYEILEELGRGAMGVVYKAKDRKLNRIVAFKTLPHTLKHDPDALENLKKEAQTAAGLNHPGIVTVYDVGQESAHCFIAMEFVEGRTLENVLRRVKRIDLTNFRHIARSLCEVVGYAHEKHVIHRDIKPSNILLTPNRSVKLMDFGLAKVLADISIDKTMLRGTPLYMSPEQVLGRDIDHRADLYALGIIFYEMLAGRPPFTEGDILYAHLHTPAPPLADRVTNVPPETIDGVMAAIEKDKARRPATAGELARSLGVA